MENLKIGEKITKVPLIQGGMGVGISLGRLAGSVAKAGGIGVISTAQIGYREPDFDKHPEEANLRAIGKEMQKARQISENGIIGYNIMTALKGYADHVKAAVKAGADLIISGAGLPVDLPALTEGSAVKIAPIVSTARSAQVILKYWDQKIWKDGGSDCGRRASCRRSSWIYRGGTGQVGRGCLPYGVREYSGRGTAVCEEVQVPDSGDRSRRNL